MTVTNELLLKQFGLLKMHFFVHKADMLFSFKLVFTISCETLSEHTDTNPWLQSVSLIDSNISSVSSSAFSSSLLIEGQTILWSKIADAWTEWPLVFNIRYYQFSSLLKCVIMWPGPCIQKKQCMTLQECCVCLCRVCLSHVSQITVFDYCSFFSKSVVLACDHDKYNMLFGDKSIWGICTSLFTHYTHHYQSLLRHVMSYNLYNVQYFYCHVQYYFSLITIANMYDYI